MHAAIATPGAGGGRGPRQGAKMKKGVSLPCCHGSPRPFFGGDGQTGPPAHGARFERAASRTNRAQTLSPLFPSQFVEHPHFRPQRPEVKFRPFGTLRTGGNPGGEAPGTGRRITCGSTGSGSARPSGAAGPPAPLPGSLGGGSNPEGPLPVPSRVPPTTRTRAARRAGSGGAAAAWEPFDWYREPRYYDVVFDQTSEDEVRFLEAVAARHGLGLGPGTRRVLEPACGSGRLLQRMALRGWRVSGFDIRPEALRFAARRLAKAGAKARLATGRFDRFRVPGGPFHLAHCLYSSLQHATEPEEAPRHLRLVCDALQVGGIYVLGLHLSDYRRRTPILERANCRRDGLRVTYSLRHGAAERATRLQPMRCRLAVTHPDGRRRRLESTWSFRTYDRSELQQLLASEPRLRLAATYNFHHDPEWRNEGPRATFDRVLVLRRER